MAETTSSQAQQNTTPKNPFQPFPLPFQLPQIPGFDPAAFGFGPVVEAWTKATQDQQARLAAMMDEYAKAEEKAVAEAKRSVEEMAKLSLATIDYARELSVNARKQTLEMAKKAAEAAHVESKKA
jgi:hypothetical protein